LRQNDTPAAFNYYEKSWEFASRLGQIPSSLVVEVLQALINAGQFSRAMQIYQSLPEDVRTTERVQLLRGQAALALDDLDAVEEVLQIDYAGVREGEIALTDLWFEMCARCEARRTGEPLDAALRKQVQELFPPPARIDFRMKNE
jgi:hypothetical protein